MASCTPTNSALDPSSRNQIENVDTKIEYNERWMGYLSIILCSAINFISISIVKPQYDRVIGVSFGAFTFLLACLVLLQDRSQTLLDYFHYTKARNGYVEGGVLVCMVLWWVVGVAIITKAGGVAYHASNIYYSSWGSLVSCLYTLNLWSTEKEIISIAELSGVSLTLKSWWVHFLSACVVFACSINLHARMSFITTSSDAPYTSYAVILGLVSIAASIFWIGVHLNFFKMWGIQEGGWFELFSSFFLMFLWIVALGVFTTDGGIAAKLEGDECKNELSGASAERDCIVTLFFEDSKSFVGKYEFNCDDIPGEIPGSNLFYSCWSCMLSSIAVAFKWKASQALRFAKAQAERQLRNEQDGGVGELGQDHEDYASR